MYDLIIIGAGPVGLYASFYAGMRDLKTLVIDSLDEVGGQLVSLYPEKYIYDVAGHEKIKAKDLIKNLEKQAARFDHDVKLAQAVQAINGQVGDFEVVTDKETFSSKYVLLTTGSGSFTPRKTGVSNESDFNNIAFSVVDPKIYDGQDVVVLGGGDSAVDYALMLEGIASSVKIVHRRDQFRAHEHSIELLDASNIVKLTPFMPEVMDGADGKLTKLTIKNLENDSLEVIKLDQLIVSYGFVSSLGFVKDLNLKMEKLQMVVNPEFETSMPGVFAAGDGCHYPNKPKLIASGFGEAIIAVNMVKKYIDPEKFNNNLHSSKMFGDK